MKTLTYEQQLSAVQAMLGITKGELECIGEKLLDSYCDDVQRVYDVLLRTVLTAPVQEPLAWMQSDEVHISLWKDNYHTIPLGRIDIPAAQPEPMRLYVEDFASKCGWVRDSGEGAFEYVQRKSYAQGLEDATPPPTQPAPVPEGWKLVPVEPTNEMWTAVNKLDDQCAAGNHNGKGCSIEQAWNCLLDAAPTPPAAHQQWVEVERIKWDGDKLIAKLKEKNA